jgi:cobalamin biosynthesis protein CobD/CbiB
MPLKNIAWWFLFTLAGVWLQHYVPGVDLLAAGLLLSLQERRPVQTFWLFTAFVFLQEGSGSLAFGGALLWYAALLVLFTLGKWLFEAENLLFILLIGLAMGVLHVVLLLELASLQDYAAPVGRLIAEGALQAVLLPAAWLVTRRCRRGLCGVGQQAL